MILGKGDPKVAQSNIAGLDAMTWYILFGGVNTLGGSAKKKLKISAYVHHCTATDPNHTDIHIYYSNTIYYNRLNKYTINY